MNDLSEKRRRYLRDDVPTRLGNLASTLAHISTFAKNARNVFAVERLLEESRFFIEWTAAETDIETAAVLVDIQVRLCWWYHHWKELQTNQLQLSTISQQSREWSDRVLGFSGLLEPQA